MSDPGVRRAWRRSHACQRAHGVWRLAQRAAERAPRPLMIAQIGSREDSAPGEGVDGTGIVRHCLPGTRHMVPISHIMSS